MIIIVCVLLLSACSKPDESENEEIDLYEGIIEKRRINPTNFPDEIFRRFISDNFDTDKNGILSGEEIRGVTKIDVPYMKIVSLKGVEHLVNLQELFCHDNKLSSLDVSSNARLATLSCAEKPLGELDVSKNNKLTYLVCTDNELKELDVSRNEKLEELYCEKNRFNSIANRFWNAISK